MNRTRQGLGTNTMIGGTPGHLTYDSSLGRIAARIDWGLDPQASEIVSAPDFARSQIPLKKYALANWAGTVHISFVMQKAGQGARANMTLRPR